MNIRIILKSLCCVGLAAMLLTSCKHKSETSSSESDQSEISILRFEKEMFGTPVDQLQERLRSVQTDYRTPMLNVFPDDPKYMEQIAGMAQDPIMREVYDTVQALYSDLDWLRKEVEKGLERLNKVAPNIHCNRIYTFISGDFDYLHRVVGGMDNELLLAIDQYAAPRFAKYEYFGLPRYLSHLLDKKYMATDCIDAIVKARIPIPDHEMSLLDYMIAEGKVLYCTKVAFPKVEDSILFRYTPEQMGWARENVADVWAYLVQHKLLYETDDSQFNNILDDAPKTNAFGNSSAPRMASYIGYLIVNEYVVGRSANVQQMLENTDSQKILQQSGWKPSRSKR